MKIFDYVEGHFVRNERFSPVERIVYSFVGIILTAVLVAIVALVIRQPTQ